MKAALLLALVATSAQADMVIRAGKNEIRLMQDACTNPAITQNIRDEWKDKFKSAHADINGKSFEACWIDTMQGHYFVLYDDGDSQILPISAFHEAGA